MFVVGQKTSKSAKIFTLENFRLYGIHIMVSLSFSVCAI